MLLIRCHSNSLLCILKLGCPSCTLEVHYIMIDLRNSTNQIPYINSIESVFITTPCNTRFKTTTSSHLQVPITLLVEAMRFKDLSGHGKPKVSIQSGEQPPEPVISTSNLPPSGLYAVLVTCMLHFDTPSEWAERSGRYIHNAV